MWFGFLFFAPFLLASALLFVFWLLMLIDAATRQFKNDSDKVVWIIVLILLGLLGAFIYYFVVYFKDSKKSLRWLWIALLIVLVLGLLLVLLFAGLFFVGSYAV